MRDKHRWKIIIAVILVIMWTVIIALAGSKGVLVQIGRSPAYERVTNYTVYCWVNTNDSALTFNCGTRPDNTTNRVALSLLWEGKPVPTNTMWNYYYLPWTEQERPDLLYFGATAQNAWGESGMSELCTLAKVPYKVPGLNITEIIEDAPFTVGFTNLPPLFTVQHSDDLISWTDLFTISIDDTNAMPHTLDWTSYPTNATPHQFWKLENLTVR